jgi:predicted RNase H-like HicB family nuclease
MTQANMHDYFIRQNQEQTAIPCEEDLDLSDYAQNRDFLKNRKVSNVVCEVEGCSEKATYGERSEVHGCFEYKRCKRHKEHFIHFTQCKWTFDSLLKLVTFVGVVMTSPDTVKSWAFDKVNSKTRISLTCPVHDRQYEQTLSGLTIGKHGCGECNGKVPWSQRVPELLDYITGQGYTLDEREDELKRGLKEEGKNYKLKLKCPEGHPYYSGTVVTFTGKQQHRCSTCAGNVPWSERVPELMDIITDKGYTLDECEDELKRGLKEEGCDYKLKLKCPNGHKYYSGTVDSFTGKRQRGCRTCAGNVPWSERVPELLDIITGRKYTLDELLEDLERGLEEEGAFYKLKLICPKGHAYYSGTVNHRVNDKPDAVRVLEMYRGLNGYPNCWISLPVETTPWMNFRKI